MSRSETFASPTTGRFATHEVFNQPPPLEVADFYRDDRILIDAVRRNGAQWAEDRLSAYGRAVAGPLQEAGALANRAVPELTAYDHYGYRIDEVRFHPAYHQLMRAGIEHGVHALAWREPGPGAQVARAALEFLHNQAESGTDCPLTMTFAAIPTLRLQPELAERWEPLATALAYDGASRPWCDKPGVTLGMAMTEKQGGTDVRANTTRAEPASQAGSGAHVLTGHKWFCSAPMSDGFLTLAQKPEGLTCFLLPRFLEDGTRNALRIERLKDKLGNRSNASAEIELDGALAWQVGEAGRGVATIIEMVTMTRFNCMVGSTAIMRRALSEASHHVAQREVMGARLAEQPLMLNVVGDLALEVEGALALTLRVARALDEAPGSEHASRLLRVVRAIGKYWICKRAPAHINEAQECLGGNGYVETSILPRLYREAPVNSIWEGSGNVQCLDVLRAMERTPEALEATLAELDAAAGRDDRFDAALAALREQLADPADAQYRAREVVERLALLLQAAALMDGDPEVARAFVASRLPVARATYGQLPVGTDCAGLLERATLASG